MKNTELHTHSYYSDGQLSPRQLVRLAKKRKIKNLALTDHDSVKGIKEAINEGKKIGVNVIPAVEIRCNAGEILSYFIDPDNKQLIKLLKENNRRVQSRIKDTCKRLQKTGYKLSYKELEKKYQKAKGNLNEFHVIYTLYKKRYAKNTFDVVENILGKNKIRFKKIKNIDVKKVIKTVKNAGGVPVLAHPWLDADDGIKRISVLVKAGLKGIEINNGDRPPFMPKIFSKKIRNVAKKYKIVITSGSDYHGEEMVKLMPGDHNLGHNNCDEKVVKQLKRLTK